MAIPVRERIVLVERGSSAALSSRIPKKNGICKLNLWLRQRHYYGPGKDSGIGYGLLRIFLTENGPPEPK